MTDTPSLRYRNQFLNVLRPEELHQFASDMKCVTRESGDILVRRGQTTDFVYLPLDSATFIVTLVDGDRGMEVPRIGSEGIVGLWSALGAPATWEEVIVHVPGEFLRIGLEAFRSELKQNGAVFNHALRYMLYLTTQISRIAACNQCHPLDQRLARWILVTQDRIRPEEFDDNQDFLPRVLGADKAQLTLAATSISKSGIVSFDHGKVKVHDREGLEKLCCECYHLLSAEYQNFSKLSPGYPYTASYGTARTSCQEVQ